MGGLVKLTGSYIAVSAFEDLAGEEESGTIEDSGNEEAVEPVVDAMAASETDLAGLIRFLSEILL